ncbi:DUF930 domain-containing protein [Bartonella tamiae]|uniref:DUF930 domain-containing protein n=1 Tax=Bartonella tamiae Th239 TaxID=1094558 RepID=J0ZR10_9HYPH|nr:DUF930 domain-containing protein [Bartonella tamiae]EJF91118.1 hypothetical protein ME5_00450 [Bartonella tamiae Th239]EJF93217.1 hypothetical protein MEG_01431 [Bartonella tamiae Th307]
MKYASCPFAAGFIYIIATTNVFAINALETQQLEQLDTQTRLEQRCDIEAMERLHKDTKWSPDKVLAYAYSDPKTGHHSIKAEGAAFRAKGKWYHLSYNCIAEDNHITIKSFDYKIGKLIPRKNWEKHYLVP